MHTNGGWLAALLGVIGIVAAPVSQSQQLVVPGTQYGVCSDRIKSLMEYGGAAYPIVSVRANADPRIKSISYAYEVGSEIGFIEASYLNVHRLQVHYSAVNQNGGWVVIGSRSALPEVKSGTLPQLVASETDPGRRTIWFAEIASPQGNECDCIYIFPGVFEEDIPKAWLQVQPTLRSPI